MPRHAFLEYDGVLAFAHRGDGEAAPENTAAAFESAVMLGYRYLETDVHCTLDGVLIAFHDDRLDRVTGEKGKIRELNYPAVARARVMGREPIPLMEDLLGNFPDTRFNIDPKSDAAVGPLIEIISVRRPMTGSASVHSQIGVFVGCAANCPMSVPPWQRSRPSERVFRAWVCRWGVYRRHVPRCR